MISVDLPIRHCAAGHDGAAGFVAYDMLVPPLGFNHILDPYAFPTPKDEGSRYLQWVVAAEADRLPYIRHLLAEAGAPLGADYASRPGEDMIALGEWLLEWIPLIFKPRAASGAQAPVGTPTAFSADEMLSRPKLLVSIAHDLAFVVVDEARQVRPELQWYLSNASTGRRVPGLPGGYARSHLPAIDPAKPGLRPITRCLQMLTRAARISLAGQFDRLNGADRRVSIVTVDRSLAQPLKDLYDDFFREPRPTSGGRLSALEDGVVFPERPFRRLLTPRGGSAPAAVVEAAAGIRASGWFSTYRGSDLDLAATLAHTWRDRHDGDLDLMDYPNLLDQSLLAMDDTRSTYEAARPDADEDHLIYRALLPQLGRLTGVDVRMVKEEWSTDLSQVRLSFRLEGTRRTIIVPDCDRYISPELFMQLNALLPKGVRYLWFPENPITEKVIVTAATVDEVKALDRTRPIHLVASPTGWWQELTRSPGLSD